LINRLVELINR